MKTFVQNQCSKALLLISYVTNIAVHPERTTIDVKFNDNIVLSQSTYAICNTL